MDSSRFDRIAKAMAGRTLSRRLAVKLGAGAAATDLAGSGFAQPASAQEATPEGLPMPDPEHVPTMLFLQSFQAGSIAPKAGEPDAYTLTLQRGLGQTIYFSDRPDRIVGAAPTPAFLDGLGFTPDNPPNAALVVDGGADDTDVVVVELFNPRYDEATHTAIYDVKVLRAWERTLDLGFATRPVELAHIHPTFGAAHLFIDDCPEAVITCENLDTRPDARRTFGTIPNSEHDGFRWSESAWQCLPSRPWIASLEVAIGYWDDQCNRRFPDCNGLCTPVWS